KPKSTTYDSKFTTTTTDTKALQKPNELKHEPGSLIENGLHLQYILVKQSVM
ncbi:3158_t:CDS:1, partial [Cetraspora pellucida]